MKLGSSFFSLIVLFFTVGLLLCGLADLAGSSEARELEVVRNVLRGNSPLFPTRIGMIPSKPPLMHWLTASILQVADREVTPGAMRAFSLLCASFVLFLTGVLAAGVSPRRNTYVPMLAVGVLASTYEFQRIAYSARVDMLFTLLVVIAIFSVLYPVYIQSEGMPKRESPWYSIFALSTSLAVLTKGPLGVVFPLFIAWVLLIGVSGWKQATLSMIRPRWQWLIFFLVAIPWYWFSAYEYSEALSSRVLFENITRFLGGEHIVSKPFWYYVPSFLLRAFPWSIVFVGALILSFRKRNTGSSLFADRKPFVLWFLAGLLLFSLSDGKRHGYLAPLFPASSIVVALVLEQWYSKLSDLFKRRLRKIQNGVPFLLLGILSLVTALLGYFTYLHEQGVPGKMSTIITGVVVEHQLLLAFFVFLCMLCCLVSAFRQRALPVVLWASLFTGVALGLNMGLAIKAEIKGYQRMADLIRRDLVDTDARFVLVKDPEDELFDPIVFYLDRIPTLMRPRDSLTQLRCGDVFLTREEFLQTWHVALGKYNFLTDDLNDHTHRALVLGQRKDC